MVTHTTPYLHFNGNCEEALKFYEKALSGDIKQMGRLGDGPPEFQKPECNNLILHAELKVGNATILASDSMGEPVTAGNNMSITLNYETADELIAAWKNMSQASTTIMELQDAFWGAKFGMLRDQYGVNWMFNCEIKDKN